LKTLLFERQSGKMSINSLKSGPLETVSLPARSHRSGVGAVYLGAMAVSFFAAYLPTYVKLANGPWQTEQEGHGPLIMLAAAWLAWQQRGKLASVQPDPAPIAGWIILAASLLLMVLTRSQDILMVEVFTQIPVLLACLLLLGGWRLALVFWFPLAFLVFSLPPPGWILDAATVPLKSWISDIVTNLLYALGYPIAQNGVMIMIGP
jgi:exosortase